MLPHKYEKQALGTCRLWWHTKSCAGARGGSLLVCVAWCAGSSNLPGDRRCTDWAGRTPGSSSRILMHLFALFLPVSLHIVWFIMNRKGQACVISVGVGGHTWLKKMIKAHWQRFCSAANADRVKSTLYSGGERVQVVENHILLKLQLQWYYKGNFTQSISLFGLKYNKEGRSPQHLVPLPLLIPLQLL